MASAVKGLSIWLSPKLTCSTRHTLRDIIKQNSTPATDFEPHVTLLSLPHATERNVEEVVNSIKKIADGAKPFEVNLKKLATGNTFHQSVLLEVEKENSTLQKLYRAAEEHAGKFADSNRPSYYPHLSLFYGQHNPSIVSRIQNQLKASKLEGHNVTLDRIDLYQTSGDSGSWVHLGSFPFQEGLFFRSALFINNQWVNPTHKNYLDVTNPASRGIFHRFPAATAEDVDKAVQAAKVAFNTWGETTGEYRSKFLIAIADKIKEKRDELAKTEVLDNGKPINEAYMDVDDAETCFRYYAQHAIELDAKQNKVVQLPDSNYSSKVRYEPTGVAGLIVPWNYPLLMATWKIAPCLAAGCTAILKPSELTPLSALEFGSIAQSVGLPHGVLNIITGLGPDSGSPLSSHPDVDKVAFTGSVPTGVRVVNASAQTIKNVTLELGGKSPFIIFGDSTVEQAVEWIMLGVFFNSGQVCSSTSRVLIQSNIYDKVIQELAKNVANIRVGNGLDPETKLGPVVSEGQYNKILGFIGKGIQEGATLLTGGFPVSPELQSGYFVPPTVFINVSPNMTIWKEEIFGPVLSIARFETEEEAIFSANNTTFGLAGAVMSKDRERCERVAKKLRAGIVWINCSQPTFCQAPWGGMKRSGVGRELGPWGIENYLEVKQVTSYENATGLGFEWYVKAAKL